MSSAGSRRVAPAAAPGGRTPCPRLPPVTRIQRVFTPAPPCFSGRFDKAFASG